MTFSIIYIFKLIIIYIIFTTCKFWLLNVKFVFAREKSRAFFL